jgi:serine/threonine protein kinase
MNQSTQVRLPNLEFTSSLISHGPQIRQILLHGLDFMHSLGVIRGDLKAVRDVAHPPAGPELSKRQVDILIDEHCNFQLVDFGTNAVMLNSLTQAFTMTGESVGGTLRYMASVLHNDNPKLNGLSGKYALAMTLWEVCPSATCRLW